MGKTLTYIFWGLALSAVVCQELGAQSQQWQILPEIDTYWTLNPGMRLNGFVARTKDSNTFNSTTIGAGINFFVKPLSPKRRTNKDEANRKLLTFGVTYRYLANMDKASENRVQFDAAPKYPLPKDMLIDDRNRLELRIISSDVTWRYRNRLTFQRTFQSDRFRFTPYARAEAFYEINQSKLSELTYSLGVFIPIRKQIEIESYYEGQNYYESNPSHVNAIGITLAFYFRRGAPVTDDK